MGYSPKSSPELQSYCKSTYCLNTWTRLRFNKVLHPCSQWKSVKMLLCQKSKAVIIPARNKFLGRDKQISCETSIQNQNASFVRQETNASRHKKSQSINYFTDIVCLKWAFQPISNTYDDPYQEKFNTMFWIYSFLQIIHLLKHSFLTHHSNDEVFGCFLDISHLYNAHHVHASRGI